VSIAEDIQKLNPGALVELFLLDATPVGGVLNYFHAGTNGLRGAVVWQGNAYQPWPIQARGFDKSATGRLPRPTLTMSNVNGIIGAIARDYNDLLGAKLIRKRTFVKYLDAGNFPGNANPTADPNAAFPDDVFYVDQKTTENRHVIEFALAAKMDLAGVSIPLRVVAQTCAWQYRGEGCGYAGGPVADVNDTSTADPTKDQCGKRLTSCKLRFTGTLPFGGFPGTALLR
jgi:lambda family phage minor tail protein L